MNEKSKKLSGNYTVSDYAIDTPIYHSVERPEHYSSGQVECIDAMISAFGAEAVREYCRVNAFKYVWRAGEKGDVDTEKEDVRKAIWYLRMSVGDDPRGR